MITTKTDIESGIVDESDEKALEAALRLIIAEVKHQAAKTPQKSQTAFVSTLLIDGYHVWIVAPPLATPFNVMFRELGPMFLGPTTDELEAKTGTHSHGHLTKCASCEQMNCGSLCPGHRPGCPGSIQ